MRDTQELRELKLLPIFIVVFIIFSGAMGLAQSLPPPVYWSIEWPVGNVPVGQTISIPVSFGGASAPLTITATAGFDSNSNPAFTLTSMAETDGTWRAVVVFAPTRLGYQCATLQSHTIIYPYTYPEGGVYSGVDEYDTRHYCGTGTSPIPPTPTPTPSPTPTPTPVQQPPPQPEPPLTTTSQPRVSCPAKASGSIIEIDNLVVGEKVPIVGAPFSLYYYSDRVPGRIDNYKVHIPLTTNSIQYLTQVNLDIKYAGREFSQSFAAQPNLAYDFIWDGKDTSGVPIEGSTEVFITLTNIGPGGSRTSSSTLNLGSWNAVNVGLGAWTFDILHYYDVNAQRIYFGSGGSFQTIAIPYYGNLLVSSQDASEAYIFDPSGRLLQTRSAITGIPKYTFTYDLNGYLTSIIDAFQNQTRINHSGATPTQIIAPNNQITQLGVDTNGWLSSITNPNGESFQMSSTSSGLLMSFKKPGGQLSTMSYDNSGYLIKDQNSAGNFVNLLRSTTSSGWQIQTNTAENRQTNYLIVSDGISSSRQSIDPRGLITTSVSQPGGTSSDQSPDGVLSLSTSAPDPRFGAMAPFATSSSVTVQNTNLNYVTRTSQDVQLSNSGDILSVQSLLSKTILQNDTTKVFTSRYDQVSNSFTQTTPLGRTTTIGLDAAGSINRVTLGNLQATQFQLNSKGHIASIQQGPRKYSFTYDQFENLAQTTDPLGHVTMLGYDLAGRMTEKTDANNQKTKFGYDANGNLTSVTPAGRSTHQFTLNPFELVANYLPPFLGGVSTATTYSYNLDQQLTQVNYPDGRSISYNYKSQSGELVSATTPNGNYNFSYSTTTGQLTNLTSPDGVSSNFNYQGPLLSLASTNIAGLQTQLGLSYNPDFSLQSLLIQDQPVAFTYDRDGSPTAIGDENLIYDGQTSLLTATNLNKISELRSLNEFGEIKSDAFAYASSAKKSNAIYSYELSRDSSGRISEKIEQIKGSKVKYDYSYDSVGRLSDVKRDRSPFSHYEYDSNGNRTLAKNQRTIRATYDSQDRLISYGDLKFKYSLNGELIEKDFFSPSHKNIYNYDVLGNLKSIDRIRGHRSDKIEYLIDGQNRRVGRKLNGKLENIYLYQSQTQIAAELDGTGKLLKEFIYASKSNVPDYMVKAGVEYRIISDQIGSPRIVIQSSTGKIVEEILYDEFGRTMLDTNPGVIPFGFAGGLYDPDTKLVQFGARDYDPETGRFLSKDPILFGGGSTNLYGYAMQDPVNWIDPTGRNASLYQIGAHTVLVVDDPKNPGGKVTIELNPRPNSSTSDSDMLTGKDIPGRVTIEPGTPPGLQIPFTLVTQDILKDQALIDKARRLQTQFENGTLKYNLYGTGNNTQCTGFAAGLLFGK